MLIEEIKKIPSQWMYDHLESVFDQDISNERTIKIEEYLKFIYISSCKEHGFIPLTKEIDEIWHEYILQTKEYEKLCMSLPGKKFIHHQTSSLEEYIQNKEPSEVIRNMLEWLPYYFYYFGVFTLERAKYWTIVKFLIEEVGLTLNEINKISKEEADKIFINK